MRSISQALQNRIAETELTLGYLVTITRRDGTVVRMTTTGSNVDVDGHTYQGNPGVFVGSVTASADGEPTQIDIDIPVDYGSQITRTDLRAGFYDNALIEIDLFSYSHLSINPLRIATGRMGGVDFNNSGLCKIAFRGLWGATANLTIWTYGPGCRARLGDEWCQVPILPDDVARSTAYAEGDRVRVEDFSVSPTNGYRDRMFVCVTAGTTASGSVTYDYTVGEETTDGTAVFQAEQAWTREGVVATVPDHKSITITVTEARSEDDWFTDGAIRFTSGDNAGLAYEIRKHTHSTAMIKFWVAPRAAIQVGDTFEIHPGWKKNLTHCAEKFANFATNGGLRYQGFPHLPGENFAFGGYYAEGENEA